MKKLPVSISENEYIMLIKATTQPHHKLAYLLGFESGLRISEITNLEPSDINLKENNILVRQGKGSKDRIVPLPKRFKDNMIKLIPLKIKVRALERAFLRSAEKSGILKDKPELHFHSLRHGFGSQMAKKGVPIHYIRTLMGHASISTTNVYLEANPQEALKKYQELF